MSEAIVETKAGGVQGERLKGFRQWLGLRYATAPRFAAPGPVEPWQGVRRADRFGRQCAQAMGRRVPRRFVDSNEFGEDCHFLNVYAPDGGTPGPKPVLVWIHGGAFVGGSANPYDGSRLACEGDIIVVTINYRLGVLGFVNFGDLPGLSAIPSNLGLRDQIAALEWVRDNIAAFGGDPGRVTICGQSAGSISVSLLLLSRQARGLFHGAVMQSGAVSLTHDRERSIADARRYAELLGIERGGLAALRALDIAHLLEVQGKVASELRNAIPAAPWFDDDLLPDTLEAARVHDAAPVPLLAGATHDENRLFELMPGNLLPTRRADLEPIIRDQLGLEQAGRILSAYPAGRKGQTALGSDLAFKVPTRNFAQRQAALAPVWYYQFDYAHPVAGAAHGLDLTLFWPFPGARMALVRGGRDNGWRKALGERMREHVARFVRRGDPADGWPRYEPQRQAVHIYDLADSLVEAPDAVRFAAWDGRDVTPGKSVRPVPRG